MARERDYLGDVGEIEVVVQEGESRFTALSISTEVPCETPSDIYGRYEVHMECRNGKCIGATELAGLLEFNRQNSDAETGQSV